MKLFSFRENFKYIAWFFWFIFVFNALTDIYTPLTTSTEDIQRPEYFNMLIASLIIVASIEVLITVLIRYFALIRPFKKGTYSPHKGPWRFLLVGIINWICSGSIVVYGSVLYFLSGENWTILFFGALGIVILLFHSPRLGPFKEEQEEDPDIEDLDSFDAPFKL